MLTSKQRAILRGKANTMDPVYIVGKGEIDETLIQGVKDCLVTTAQIPTICRPSMVCTIRNTLYMLTQVPTTGLVTRYGLYSVWLNCTMSLRLLTMQVLSRLLQTASQVV